MPSRGGALGRNVAFRTDGRTAVTARGARSYTVGQELSDTMRANPRMSYASRLQPNVYRTPLYILWLPCLAGNPIVKLTSVEQVHNGETRRE